MLFTATHTLLHRIPDPTFDAENGDIKNANSTAFVTVEYDKDEAF
jgi:hypothetical protein